MIKLMLQHADQEDIADELGPVDLPQALAAFREFPWTDQLVQANELQLCSPSLFLEDDSDGSKFFVSILDGEKLDFMVNLETAEVYEGWTLFGKRQKERWVNIDSDGHDAATAQKAVELFFTDRNKLRMLIDAKARSF